MDITVAARTDELLGLTPAQALTYAQTCRDDVAAMRVLLDEAMATIGAQRDRLDRATTTIESQTRLLVERRRDHRDAVIEIFAQDEVILHERIASLEADVLTYRELALTAIAALSDKVIAFKRQREQHHRLIDAYRALRAATKRAATTTGADQVSPV